MKLNKTNAISLIILLVLLTAITVTLSSSTTSSSIEIDELVSHIKLKKGMNLCGEEVPLTDKNNETFEREIGIMLNSKIQVIMWIKRANRYFPIIEEELKKNNMPDDLKYIAIIESSLKPHIGSPKGAKGFWQFMKGTAKNIGLTVNDEIDERRNIIKSTRGAIKYLKSLHKKFNSWSLAAAAYNMGEDGLMTRIILQETDNFFDLYLSLETMQYVYRIIAAKTILSDPNKFGFDISEDDCYKAINGEDYTISISEKEISLNLIAKSAGITFKEFKELNPEVRGFFLKKGKHNFLFPNEEAVNKLKDNLDKNLKIWKDEIKKNIYSVVKGDNLTTIAAKHDLPINLLLMINHLTIRSTLKIGQKIIIPVRK